MKLNRNSLRRKSSTWLAWVASAGLLLSCVVPNVGAQALSSSQVGAVKELASMAAGSADHVDALLDRIGYQPEVPISTWRSFPALRKIESAVLAAEAYDPGRGGERALSLMSRSMAQQYGAASHDLVLRPYLALETPSQIQFAPELVRPGDTLDAASRKAVTNLTVYAEGSRLGGMHSVMVRHAGLSSDAAYEILRTSATSEDAMVRAWERVPEAERPGRLRKLAQEVRVAYPSANLAFVDPSMGPIEPKNPNSRSAHFRGADDGQSTRGGWPDGSGPGGGPGNVGPDRPDGPRTPGSGPGGASMRPDRPSPRGSGGTGSVPGGRQKYDTFMSRNYPTPASRGFRSMRGRIGGFGGVIFGNDVSDDSGTGRLDAVVWSPFHDSDEVGQLIIWTESGDKLLYSPVWLEDAAIAARLVAQHRTGDGIGLVGVSDPGAYYECTPESLSSEGARYQVTIHPLLADSDLGWAALMVDILPIQQSNIIELVSNHAEASGLEPVLAWLSSGATTWKVTDSPISVSAENSKIRVRRSDKGAETQVGTTETLLDMYGFFGWDDEDDSDASRQYSADFRRALPHLLQASYDYERMNDFAGVLAIYRWAKSKGADCPPPLSQPSPRPTPGSIVITEDLFFPLGDMSSRQIHEKMRDDTRECLPLVLERSEFPGHRTLRLDRLEAELVPLIRRYESLQDSIQDMSTREATILAKLDPTELSQVEAAESELAQLTLLRTLAVEGTSDYAAIEGRVQMITRQFDANPAAAELISIRQSARSLSLLLMDVQVEALGLLPEVSPEEIGSPEIEALSDEFSRWEERYLLAPEGSDTESEAWSEMLRLEAELEEAVGDLNHSSTYADDLLSRFVHVSLAAGVTK